MTTRLLTIRTGAGHVALILNDAKDLPVGLLAINDPALLDSIVTELQAARALCGVESWRCGWMS